MTQSRDREQLAAFIEMTRHAISLGFVGGTKQIEASEAALRGHDELLIRLELRAIRDWMRHVSQIRLRMSIEHQRQVNLAALRLPKDRVTVLDMRNAPDDIRALDLSQQNAQAVIIPHCLGVRVSGSFVSSSFQDFDVEVIRVADQTGRERD